jgi:hypothetical protein
MAIAVMVAGSFTDFPMASFFMIAAGIYLPGLFVS